VFSVILKKVKRRRLPNVNADERHFNAGSPRRRTHREIGGKATPSSYHQAYHAITSKEEAEEDKT
jgi:hypothetical protein